MGIDTVNSAGWLPKRNDAAAGDKRTAYRRMRLRLLLHWQLSLLTATGTETCRSRRRPSRGHVGPQGSRPQTDRRRGRRRARRRGRHGHRGSLRGARLPRLQGRDKEMGQGGSMSCFLKTDAAPSAHSPPSRGGRSGRSPPPNPPRPPRPPPRPRSGRSPSKPPRPPRKPPRPPRSAISPPPSARGPRPP